MRRRSVCRRQPVLARLRPCRRPPPAARVKITREIRLTPATSTIDGMSTTSLLPTYAPVSPAATVETHTLGTPTGRARMAAVTTLLPPDPPMPTMPSNRPSAYPCSATLAAPSPIAFMAAPRSPATRSDSSDAPAAAATSLASTSTAKASHSPITPVFTDRTSWPRAKICSRKKAYSTPFVSNAPTIIIVAITPSSSWRR